MVNDPSEPQIRIGRVVRAKLALLKAETRMREIIIIPSVQYSLISTVALPARH
jgi:hypothetical protein